MKIAVCIKEIPDISNVRISKSQQKVFEENPRILNPADEAALEFALSLKDKEKSTQVFVISVGENEKILRYAYAMGADMAYLVWDEAYKDADPFVISNILSKTIKKLGGIDMVVTGNGSIAGWGGQVGPRIAEELEELKVDLRCIAAESVKPRIPRAKETVAAFNRKIERFNNESLELDKDFLMPRTVISRSYLTEG